MASIWWEEPVAVSAEVAWNALRRTGEAHRLFSPVLADGAMDGDVRVVTFANGMVVRERIVDVDEERRRLSYSVMGDLFDHHSGSMQIVPVDEGRCRFVWVSDFLPDERRAVVLPLVEQGSRALAENLESGRLND
ncbi:SRPBCC family protein [Inquilinus sp. CAU 1745]|uniref:SRPBCC family protein n=1 Tax=Inquilinus sp. CAU 1745 TaxID=3140369 RepID=UPI00325BE3AD